MSSDAYRLTQESIASDTLGIIDGLLRVNPRHDAQDAIGERLLAGIKAYIGAEALRSGPISVDTHILRHVFRRSRSAAAESGHIALFL